MVKYLRVIYYDAEEKFPQLSAVISTGCEWWISIEKRYKYLFLKRIYNLVENEYVKTNICSNM